MCLWDCSNIINTIGANKHNYSTNKTVILDAGHGVPEDDKFLIYIIVMMTHIFNM